MGMFTLGVDELGSGQTVQYVTFPDPNGPPFTFGSELILWQMDPRDQVVLSNGPGPLGSERLFLRCDEEDDELPDVGQARDYSTYGRHATKSGALLTDAMWGKGYIFDGTDDKLTVPYHSDFNLATSWTLSFVASKVTFANTNPGFFKQGDAATDGWILYYANDGTLTMKMSNLSKSSTSGLFDSTLATITVRYNRTTQTLSFWRDGIKWSEQTSVNFTAPVSTSDLEIGRADDYGNHIMDDIRVYGKALTDLEISQLTLSTRDRSNLDNNGIIRGAVELADGAHATGLKSSAYADYIITQPKSILNVSGRFSLLTFIIPTNTWGVGDGTTGWRVRIGKDDDGGASKCYSLGYWSNGGSAKVVADITTEGNTRYTAETDMSLTGGKVYAWANVFDMTTLKLYVGEGDTAEEAAMNLTLKATTAVPAIRHEVSAKGFSTRDQVGPTGTYQSFVMDEVRLFNSALDLSQLKTVMGQPYNNQFIPPTSNVKLVNVSKGGVEFSVRDLTINETTDSGLDEFAFSIRSKKGDAATEVSPGDQLKMYVTYAGEDDEQFIFQGFVHDISWGSQYRKGDWHVSGYCGGIKLQDLVLNTTYKAKDLGEIVKDVAFNAGLTTSNVRSPWGVTVDELRINQRTAWEVISDLARTYNAVYKVDKDLDLHFQPRGGLTDSGLILWNGWSSSQLSFSKSMSGVANRIKVTGASDVEAFHNAGTHNSYARVTSASQVKRKIFVPSDRIFKIIVRTAQVSGSADQFIVRIQADESGTNSGVDLANMSTSHEALTNGGDTEIVFPPHVLGAGNEYWIVFDAGGTTGVDVSQDTTPLPVFSAYHEKPVIIQREDNASKTAIGRWIDYAIHDDNIGSRSKAEQVADAELLLRSQPYHQGSFTGENRLYLDVTVGETMWVRMEDEQLPLASFLINSRSIAFLAGTGVTTALTITERDRTRHGGDTIRAIIDRLSRIERARIRKDPTLPDSGANVSESFGFSEVIDGQENASGTFAFKAGDAAITIGDTLVGV